MSYYGSGFSDILDSGNCSYSSNICNQIFFYQFAAVENVGQCLFGYICQNTALYKCGFNVRIGDCSSCRSSTVIGLAIVAGLIAFLALFLNVLVIATVLNVKRNRRSPFDYVKMSLAVADLLWVAQILGFFLPNISMTVNFSPNDLLAYYMMSADTPTIAFGYAVTVICQNASIYNVSFFAIQRFVAIIAPNWFIKRGKQFSILGLILVWIWTMVEMLFMVFLDSPAEFKLQYNVPTFGYTTSLTNARFFASFAINNCLPFIIMTTITIATGITIKVKMGKVSSSNRERIRRQRSIFITLALMELILIFALAPLVSLNFVLNDSFVCYGSTLATVIFWIIAASISVLDPLVYTIKDDEFKRNSIQLYRKLMGQPLRTPSTTMVESAYTATTS